MFVLNNYFVDVTKTSISGGDVAICTIKVTQTGSNVPCLNSFINHVYTYSGTNYKSDDFGFAGTICSISILQIFEL